MTGTGSSLVGSSVGETKLSATKTRSAIHRGRPGVARRPVTKKPAIAEKLEDEVQLAAVAPEEQKAELPKEEKPDYKVTRMNNVRMTAYSDMENEPGAYGNLNAIGTVLKYGKIRSAAADWSRYPLGTQFRIIGEPHIYEIDDYGSALVGTDTIDLYKPTLSAMNEWGLRWVDIEILKWGCYERSAKYLKGRQKYAHTRKMYECLQPKLYASSDT